MKNTLLCKCLALFATHSNKKNTSRFNGLFALFLMVMGMGVSWGQTSYTSTSATTAWNAARWNNSSDASPYTSAFTANNAVNFTSGTYNFAGMGASTNVGNVTVANNVTVSFTSIGSSFATNGAVRTFDIGSGGLFDFNAQSISTAAGTGFIKTGAGVFATGGGTFTGGFTLNAGTVIARGTTGLGSGSGNLLTLNGGTIASNATRSFDNTRFPSGITIGGNVQFGEMATVVSIASSTADLSFANNVSLGGSLRTLTLGNGGTQTFSGIISNTASTGITFAANANGTGKFAITNTANTYAGTTTITGGEAVFSGDLSLGTLPSSVTANSIIIDGGRLTLASAFTLDSKRGIQVGATAGTSINGGGGTYNGIIADKPSTTGFWAKQGSGLLILGGASTYSGGTFINNGTVQLGASSGSNRLPTSTLVTIGTSTKTCVFDLNGNNQQIAGLVSAESTSNTVTSTGAATLTIGGSGSNTYGGTNAGTIGGAISLVINGSGGTQTLSSANTYTGTTTVSGGTLRLNKSGGTTIPITNNVTIDGGTLQVSTNQTLNNLTLTSGTVIIDAGVTLTINGTITRTSGVIQGTATSNLVITGASGTIAFDQTTLGTTNVLKNLTISGTGTTTLSNALNITAGSSSGNVTVGSGASLATGGFLTLKSDALGTASVGNSAGSITGDVTVERYIPAKRAWRALTSPVIGSTNNSIFYNWQNNGSTIANTGVEIWSNASTDASVTNAGLSSSLLSYNSSSNSWTAITNTASTSLFSSSINNPFMVFVTGPYASTSTNITNLNTFATTLKATGTLLTGNQTYATIASKYTFIGNPYASPLDLSVMMNNTQNATASFGGNVWVWDANASGLNAVGTYNLYTSGTYTNLTSNPVVNAGTQIQSGQAFFVKSTDVATFTIKEAHKGSAFSNAVFRTGALPELLRVGLYKQVNNEWSGRDGAMTVILADADANQAPNKMANGTENIVFTKNGASFASNHHLPLVASDVLNVKVWNTTAGTNYKLKINTEEFSATNLSATLEDLFTNARTPLTLDGSAVEYPFTVTTEALSTGDRFRIVFQPSLLGNNIPKSNGFSIVPNPVTGDSFQVNLGSLATGTYSYSICNTIGQEVEKGSINNATQNTNYEVKMNNSATGIYIMKIKGNDNSVFTAKIIKK